MILRYYVRSPRARFSMKIALIVLTLFFVFPLVWMFLTSIKTRADFLATPPKWIFSPTLENYRTVTTTEDFVRAYLNSVIISVGSVLVGIIMGTPVAYGLSRFRFKGRSHLSFWILSTRFAPPVVVLIPFFIAYSRLGLTDTRIGMILIYLILNLPLIIWVMYGFINEIPIELEEAAVVDGASPLTIFLKIVSPLVAPGLVATSILALIFTWNEMLFALILTSYNARTIPVAIFNFISFMEIEWGNLCAAGMLAIVPVMVFTLIIQKRIVSGLTFGAIKS
ncbi:ABC transporter permease subunit [candidate division KSB3 bacterium]|uniref:ABC transporter permease subunit n=1 Tax=candidate division KSB3 bacterium TaxID=2044937 RepID=A0A9D5Q510_9BACT|nr:ABC transporter permease subunit [candidate division KSB3 bacterium]MBD3324314.1 ABC transporter permease subunit [candidate division KSB3 bacterium]